MFRGLATTELYEDCILSGLCKDHLKELEVKDESQKHELQRKAFLYMRLQMMCPILFDKPFRSEKIKALLDTSEFFNVNKSKIVSQGELIEQVLTLDSVVVFTLVKLCNICCAGALFRTKFRPSTDSLFVKLLTQNTMEIQDVSHFTPSLTANFSEYDESLVKISYITVLLFVRNVSMLMNLKTVLDHQDLSFQSLSKESAQWIEVGSDAFKRQCWDEAVDAFNKAAEFNPYSVGLLLNRAQAFIKLRKFKQATLDCYTVLMISPKQFGAYSRWATALFIQSQFSECVKIAEYGLKTFKHEDAKYNTLKRIKLEAIEALEKQKADSKVKELISSEKKDLPELVEASDSETETQDVPDLMDASNSDESDSEENKFLLPKEMCSDFDSEEIQSFTKRIRKLDSDEFGCFSIDEFMSLPHGEKIPLTVYVIASFDADGKGQIDFKEFIQELYQSSFMGDEKSMIKFAIRIYSMCDDGYISRDDVFQILKKKVGSYMNEVQLKRIVDQTILMVDRDRDGKITLLEPLRNYSELECQPVASGSSNFSQVNSENSKAKVSAMPTARSRTSSISNTREQKIDHPRNLNQTRVKESGARATRSRNPSISNTSEQKDDSEERIRMLQISLKDASNTLLDGCGLMAMRRFREALDEIKASPEIHKFEECDIICIKYAYAFACYQSGGFDDLQKAISGLQEMAEEHKNTTFPAAYYTIGLAYHKLNRFKQALQYFKIVDDILKKGIHAKVYVWPGLSTAINETKPDFLKNSLPALKKECENPPSPDAICRLEGCHLQPTIYFSDPDFKGFFTINCSEQCNLQYHPQCWKSIRISKNCTDKLFLEQNCFTPDCEGVIIRLQNINKEGNVEKEFIHADGKKTTKTKKSKLEKKLEIKEEKRRKRKDSSSRTESTSEVPEEIANDKPTEPEPVSSTTEPENLAKSEPKDNNGNVNPIVSQLPVDAEPLMVLKKEKIINELSNKVPLRMKENKKVKNNTFSIDEFLQHTDASVYNDYQHRLNTLRLKNQSLSDGMWSNGCTNNEKSMAAFATDCPQPQSSSNHSSANSFEEAVVGESRLDDLTDFDIPKQLVVTECLKEKIYNYFREMLGKCGPMHKDDPVLLEKINSFPEDAKIIADCGGIGKFLQQNFEFAFVKDMYICLVEQLPLAYRKINEAPLPINNPDLELSENFDVADRNPNEIFRFSSGLNPDAREYKPETTKPSRLHSDYSVTGIDKQGHISPESLSKYKLPIKIDKDNALKKDEHDADLGSSSQLKSTEGLDHSRRSSVSSTKSGSLNLTEVDTLSGNKVTELVNTFKELIKMYYSEEMKEHRPYIDVYLKPYTIGCVPKRYTRSIQTEEIEKVSRGTMKTDDEIQELKDMTSQLIQDRKVLEEEYNAALEYAKKFQNKSNVEVAYIKKELEDKVASLQAKLNSVEKEFKNEETRLEKDVKILSENLKKVKVENAAQKKEMEKLTTANESLLRDRAHLEEKIFSMQQEEQKLREDINEDTKLKINIKTLEVEKSEADKRAKSAELLLLQLKKTEFLKRIDIKKGEAAKKIKEVQDGAAMFSGHLAPLYKKNLEELSTRISNYLTLLEDIKVKFTASIDAQINEVNNGVPLFKLKPLEVQELPDIPTWNDQQMPSMFNAQPTWNVPQMGNSVYNAGAFNPFSFAPFNPTALKNNVPNLPRTNQDQKQQTLLQNGSSKSLSDARSQPSNISVPPIPKAPPPGLQKSVTPSHPAPATSMMNLNSSLPQSVVNSETKQKGGSNNNLDIISTSSSGNEGKKQLSSAIAAAATTIDKTLPEKKLSTSSLELDYKVKKNQSVENLKTLSNSFVPTTSHSESKKSADKGAKRSFEKLLNKLQEKFPNYSHSELMDCVKEFRTKRGAGLSGLSLETVINSVGEIIEAKLRTKLEEKMRNTAAQAPDTTVKPKMMPNAVLVNKKLVAESKVKEPPPMKEASAPKRSAWGVGENSTQWNGSEIDEGCIICYEEMTYKTAYKVDCGHHFHFKCIKEWLDKKSDCPICRVHLLLPEDYPALS